MFLFDVSFRCVFLIWVSLLPGASKAAFGLCTFARAMKFYYEASKIVKPKLEALAIAAGELEEANSKLAAAEIRLEGCKATLAGLKEKFEKQMNAKQEIEEGALKLKRTMTTASTLIGGLAGEQIRWTEDSAEFGAKIDRLVRFFLLVVVLLLSCGCLVVVLWLLSSCLVVRHLAGSSYSTTPTISNTNTTFLGR
jgi:dynein heavy chain